MSSNEAKVFSDRDRVMYELVNYVLITGVISLIGVVANVMNMVVFYKQGFTSTMNISFFGLAISDLCGLLMQLWFGMFANPLFSNSDLPIVISELQYLTVGLPHICFARITGWITVYITTERCLCIMIPLKIKDIITPRRTTIIVTVIYLVIVVSFLPEYATTYIGWKFYPESNKTLLGLLFTENRSSAEGVVYILYSVLGSSSFIAVIVFTIVLVVQLKRKSTWRTKAAVDKSMSDSINNREKKAVAMVVMIATLLIVCYTPGVIVSIVTVMKPEFSIVGQLVNAFFVLWSFAFIFQALNSSINIIFYYKMSSKYRETFHKIVLACLDKQ